MNICKTRSIVAVLCLSGLGALVATRAEIPTGWMVAGSAPKDFEFSRDPNESWQGHNSALISAKPGVVSNGFGTLMQTISAEDYRGGRLRLSGYLKTRDAVRAQMWMRVDATDRSVASFDNMDSRPITGTTDWTRYDIVLNAPSNSADVAFGFLLSQGGKVWGSSFKLERADASAAVTSAAPAALPKQPMNLDFKAAADAAASTPPSVPDVTVTTPPPPSAEELAGDSLYQFVVHHATVHFFNTGSEHNLARWRGGKQSICAVTSGLDPGYSAFVTARLRALAAYVGAPVQQDPQCKANVQLVFTDKPKEKMDEVLKWATSTAFRNRYAGGTKHLIEYKGDHAIQGWYLTTNGGSAVVNTDVDLVGINVWPLWPQITPNYLGSNAPGTRVGASSGSGIGIGVVILIVDSTRVVGHAIGTIADYLSMLTLSVAQSPDHCDPLPSILDLESSSCGTRGKPTAMTAGDLAFLKALYSNPGISPSLSRDDIQDSMLRQFKLR
ncbi:MAG TPA: hypothetical protein VN815_16240 [Steroidobacteraceae bacterium]|nr:hypothetical protein [Steroidobacteraceae bacterium]